MRSADLKSQIEAFSTLDEFDQTWLAIGEVEAALAADDAGGVLAALARAEHCAPMVLKYCVACRAESAELKIAA